MIKINSKYEDGIYMYAVDLNLFISLSVNWVISSIFAKFSQILRP